MRKANEIAILALAVAGFLAMAVEVRYLHQRVVPVFATALLGEIGCFVAAVGALLAMSGVRTLRTLGMLALGAAAICGLIGFRYHGGFQAARIARAFVISKSGTTDASAGGPPPFAPLALTGLSAIALLAVPPAGRKA